MCLNTKSIAPESKIAKEDIICYKYLSTSTQGRLSGVFYQSFTYELGVPAYSKLKLEPGSYFSFVEEGLHSFSEPVKPTGQFASYLISNIYRRDWESYDLYECRIPKGAEYYEGVWEDNGVPSYASNQLIVDKVIK